MAEASRNDDRCRSPFGACRRNDAGHGWGRCGDNDEVWDISEVLDPRDAGDPVDLVIPRVDEVDGSFEPSLA